MTTITTHERRIETRPPSTLARAARGFYAVVAWLVPAAIILQVFFAGLGLLVDEEQLGIHRGFGYVILPLPLAMLAAGLAARLPRRRLALTALLIPLLILQYTLVYVPTDGDLAALRALHPVNALILFWLALHLAGTAR